MDTGDGECGEALRVWLGAMGGGRGLPGVCRASGVEVLRTVCACLYTLAIAVR